MYTSAVVEVGNLPLAARIDTKRTRSYSLTVGRVLGICAIVAVGCGEDSSADSTSLTVRFVPTEDARRISLRVQDRDLVVAPTITESLMMAVDEERIAVRLSPRDPFEEGAFRLIATQNSLRGRELGTQRLHGAYVEGEDFDTELVFSESCRASYCASGQRCVDGNCIDACWERSSGSRFCELLQNDAVYVDARSRIDKPSDSDIDCKSPDTPCQDIQFTLENYAQPGIVIYVHGGSGSAVYPPFEVTPNHMGVENLPVHIRAWPGTERPVIEVQPSQTGVQIGKDGSGVSGFEFRGSGRALTVRDGEHVVISDCVFDDFVPAEAVNVVGFVETVHAVLQRSSLARVRSNLVDGDANAFVALDSLNTQVVANRFFGNPGWQVRIDGDDAVVRDNVVSDGEMGITVTGHNVTLSNNRLCNHSAVALRVARSDAFEVTHNTVFGSEVGVSLVGSTHGLLSDNVLADIHAVGIEASQGSDENTSSHNLFDGEGRARDGFLSSDPSSELEAPALLIDTDSCSSIRLAEESPARDAARDGQFLGAD
ncbi:MAG: right-handed parallel beta-helix repeat-containing protein [Myxococcota bacterium]